jgi:VWFA-related protein
MRSCAALFLVTAGILAGQASPKDSGVVLRSTTRLVQVNVVVQDKRGRPVTNLEKEDFIVRDNGKQQEIKIFSIESKSKPYVPAGQLPPNVFSNRIEQRTGTPNSVTIILLDGLNTRWGDQLSAVPHVIKFLQQIQPGDRVALFGLSRDLRVLHDYTSESDQLLRTLATYQGLYSSVLATSQQVSGKPAPGKAPRLASEAAVPETNPNDPEEIALQGLRALLEEEEIYSEQLRIKTSLKALEAIANHVASIPGRKNLVWVSSAFPLVIGFLPGPAKNQREPAVTGPNSAQTPAARSRTPGQRNQPSAEPEDVHMKRIFGRAPMTFDAEVSRAVHALNNANLAVYPVDARGLTTDPGASTNIGTMKELAERTGGKAYYNRNDLQNSIREAVADSWVTYTLAYYPSEQNQDGRFREIRVRVNRPGLLVRHRKGYFDAGEPDAADDAARDAVMADAVWSPLDATGVRLDARVNFTGEPQGGQMLVEINVDASSLTLEQRDGRWNGKVDMLLLQTDDQGNGLEPISQTIRVEATEETYQKALKSGFVFRRAVTRQAGAKALRIVVRDAPSGSLGSLSVPFSKLVLLTQKPK